MKLSDFLPESSIKVPLESRTKEGIVRELVDILHLPMDDALKRTIIQSVFERERELSTGIGNGVALPHGSAPIGEDVAAALGIPTEPVDFSSIDGKPVHLVLLLVADKAHPEPNLRALAGIAHLLHDPDFRSSLSNSRSAAEVMDVIRSAEKNLPHYPLP